MLVANNKIYRLSFHAQQRLSERGIPLRWLKQVMEQPDSVSYDWRDNSTYFAFLKSNTGRIYPIKVVVDDENATIVTVMFTG